MSQTQRKRMGRPRKSPLEKGEQFSIRLDPLTKAALEIIARDQNLSLSDTIQRLIKKAAEEYRVDGELLRVHMMSGMQVFNDNFETLGDAATQEGGVFRSKIFLLFLMPDALLSPDERALVCACLEARKLPSDDKLAILHADSTTMTALGVEFEKVVEHLAGRLKADI